jgi:hypothetical protein
MSCSEATQSDHILIVSRHISVQLQRVEKLFDCINPEQVCIALALSSKLVGSITYRHVGSAGTESAA